MDQGAKSPVLIGFEHSVYTRSARIALAEKGVVYDYVECNPFAAQDHQDLTQAHPFGRVPVLRHDGFDLFETAAILGYVDQAFDGPNLTPQAPRATARMRQVIGIIDNYAYLPLVRQAFSHGVYRPLMGEEADETTLAAGLAAAPAVLQALNKIAAEGLVLRPGQICLSGCHLLPMLAYFAKLDAGQDMIAEHEALTRWLASMQVQPSARLTEPDLTKGAPA